MTIADLKIRIQEGLDTPWRGGVAVVHDGTNFDAVPPAYLTDVSWSGRGKATHVVTYHVLDFLEEDDATFARELAGYLERALERQED
jgi:hypothetical protein